MENEISYYIYKILKKQLQDTKISNYGLYQIMNDINQKLSSLIYNWKDIEFRNSILVVGKEEGIFYEPKINDDVSNLVVVAIRNSLLENICSVDYKQYGLNKPISNNILINITSEAIKYFATIDLNKINIEIDNDFYRETMNRYPTASQALLELSKCSAESNERNFKSNYTEPYIFPELNIKSEKAQIFNYESGISDEFNESLIHLLKGIRDKQSNFLYVDSFKFITRNFEKLLKVVEFLITNESMLITNNFLIIKDYVSRRVNIKRAGHGDFNLDAISTITDISNKYKDILLEIQSSFLNN